MIGTVQEELVMKTCNDNNVNRRLSLRKGHLASVMVIVMVLCFSAQFMTVDAATTDEAYAGNQLKQLGVLTGYPDGTLRLDQTISRSEVAAMMVRVRGYGSFAPSGIPGEGKAFTDVATSYWAYNYIQNAYKLNIISGYPEGEFRPLSNITYQEVVAIMVNTLGYKDKLEGEWPNNYLNKAKQLGIIPSNSQVEPTKIVTRGEMSLIVWDTLLVKLSNTNILE